jgi:hypothetical protein
MQLKSEIGTFDWVMIPEANCSRGFYSAALGRRIFGECPVDEKGQNAPQVFADQMSFMKSNVTREECSNILNRYNFKYVILTKRLNSDLRSTCLRYADFIETKFYLFFKINRNLLH